VTLTALAIIAAVQYLALSGDHDGADTWRRISAAGVQLANTTPPGPARYRNAPETVGWLCHFEDYLAGFLNGNWGNWRSPAA
jgi:hypothetical protein